MKKICVSVLLLVVLSSCGHHDSNAKKQINPEILGKWQDGFGCNLELTLTDNKLILLNFSNSTGLKLSNQQLRWYKESVFTNFVSTESVPVLSGSFSDGLILIGNSLCKQSLHKANSI